MSLLVKMFGTLMLGVVLCAPALSQMTDEQVTEFFKSHTKEIEFRESGDRLLFTNRQVGIEFRKQGASLQLTRLYGIADGRDFLTAVPESTSRDLFEIRTVLDPRHVDRDDRGKTARSLMGVIDEMAKGSESIGPSTAKTVSWRCEERDTETILHLEWKTIDVKEESGVLDVHATVRLRAGDPLSYWRIDVRNRGARYGIERVRFPIIHLAPIAQPGDNVLTVPQSRGRLVRSPFKEGNIHGYYTCDFEMQFQSLYNEKLESGIYLATQQSVPCLSHLQIASSSSEIKWVPAHFPPNISFAQESPNDDAEDFKLSYDVVVGPFQGDWYDACQIYRGWAIKQSWCGKGPLSQRKDIPQWYKESPLYFYTILNDSAEGTHSMEENLRIATEDFRAWLKWAGMKLPMNLYAWEQPTQGMSVRDMPFQVARSNQMSKSGRWSGMTGHNFYDGNYPAIPATKEMSPLLAKLRSEGGMVSPYVAAEMFNPGPADNAPYVNEARPHAVRDLYGCIQTWGGEQAWQMCSASVWWRDRLKETCSLLIDREHAGGIYLDVMRGSCLPCYWTPHGHTAAGGDSMTTSRHDLVGAIRDVVKGKDPEAIITGENPSENMIDVIDGMLVYTLWPDNAPLMATVYQDYIKRYGLELSTGLGYRERFKDKWDENAFFIECASMFVEGAQLGRVRLKPRDASLSLSNPEQTGMIDFLGKLVAYYRLDASKRLLSYGQLMRPLKFNEPSQMPMIAYKPGGEFPALMSGVFRGDDGTLGIFIVNAFTNEIPFKSELKLDRYQLGAGKSVSVSQVASDGNEKPVAKNAAGSVVLEGTVPGHDLRMFRIVPNP